MKFDLEERLIKFSSAALKVVMALPDNKVCNHLGNQLLRSCTAPTLLYGEACAAESPKDFIHKMGVALKELKETRLCLKLIENTGFLPDGTSLKNLINENEQLVAIFGASINTARRNGTK